MNWSKLWRWGVVLPATLLGLAGGAADIVTGTLFYWWLLTPAYVVIFINVWRWIGEFQRPAAPATDALVERVAPLTPVSAVIGVVQGLLRLIGAFGITFTLLVCIWGAIAFLTWVRPYWTVYVPVLFVLAGIAWLIWREGAPRKRRRRSRRLGAGVGPRD